MTDFDLNNSISRQLRIDSDASSSAELRARLAALEERLRESSGMDETERARLRLSEAQLRIGLEQGEQAWAAARQAFDVFIAHEQWEHAVEACDAMFLSEQDGSIAALGHGIWLAVTYPVDPSLTLGMLQHVIDETPDDADGAAVAAAAARYVVDLRAQGRQREDLLFFANQMLGNVAHRHSNVTEQRAFDIWLQKLELTEPEKFLVRLRNVVDVLVQDDWWFDRDALRERLPDN